MLYRTKLRKTSFFKKKKSSYKLRIFKLRCLDFTLVGNRDPTNLRITLLLYYPIKFESVGITVGNPRALRANLFQDSVEFLLKFMPDPFSFYLVAFPTPHPTPPQTSYLKEVLLTERFKFARFDF